MLGFPRFHALASLGVLAAVALQGPVPAAQAAPLPAPPANVLRMALSDRCLDYARRADPATAPNAAPPEAIASLFYDNGGSLVLATAAQAGSPRAAAAVRRQIRQLILPRRPCGQQAFNTASSEPTAASGVGAQSELWATAMFVVARHTPKVWDALSRSERQRMDLVMRGTLVSNAFATSDSNPYVLQKRQRTIDGGGNVNRDWNPNYREGMVGGVLMGIAYFGPRRAQRELSGWNRARFVQDVSRRGLSNLATTFDWGRTHPKAGVPTDAEVLAALSGWRYHGTPLNRPMALYAELTHFTYGMPVACGANDGKGVAVRGPLRTGGRLADPARCAELPPLGQPGMLREFASGDSGGTRSSATYAYLGFKANLATHVALLASGTWNRRQLRGTHLTASQLMRLKRVGIADLFTKLRIGYVNYSRGGLELPAGYPSGDFVQRITFPAHYRNGYAYTQALWSQVERSRAMRSDR